MKKIIHADNSEFFRKQMKTFLIEQGYTVESCNSGEEVLDVVNTGDAALVLTGLTLFDMDGEELIKKIATSRHTVPVIAVTASDTEMKRMKLSALGVKAMISKNGSWQEDLLPYLLEAVK
ncbi:MAG: response regulator [Spirochaetaceae bacterium]|nr:response regulator [Spirochaetaceae bacterium]